MERLETERLVLRRLRPGDADGLVEALSDPEVMRYIGTGETGGRETAERAIERANARFDANGFGQLAVLRRHDRRFLGRAGFLAWSPDTWEPGTLRTIGPTAEIEVGWIFAQEHWGHGYATEAGRALVAAAFGELGLTRLISLIQAGNERSIRVAEKLGERYERDVVTRGRSARLYALER